MKPKQMPLRQYTREQVAAFLREDELDAETEQIAKRFPAGTDHAKRSEQEKQAA